MVDFLLEINDSGDTLEINDSNDQLLILDDTIVAPAEGGQSGGSSKQVGESVFDQDPILKKKKRQALGERPIIKSTGESVGLITIKANVTSFGSLLIPLKSVSECIVTPRVAIAISVSKITITEKIRADAPILTKFVSEAVCRINPFYYFADGLVTELSELKDSMIKIEKLKLLTELYKMMEKE